MSDRSKASPGFIRSEKEMAAILGPITPTVGSWVVIDWLDSGMYIEPIGWKPRVTYADMAKLDRMSVTTVGHLVHIDDDTVLVGLSWDRTHDAWQGMQLIARQNIDMMRELS